METTGNDGKHGLLEDSLLKGDKHEPDNDKRSDGLTTVFSIMWSSGEDEDKPESDERVCGPLGDEKHVPCILEDDPRRSRSKDDCLLEPKHHEKTQEKGPRDRQALRRNVGPE